MKLPLNDERVQDLLGAWGVPYVFGAGAPKDGSDSWPAGAFTRGARGWDCSGFAQAALVRLGILSPAAPDRGVAGLYALPAALLAPGDEKLGDLAFYGAPENPSHVAVVVNTGVILGANGGHVWTNGNDPTAYVKLERLEYWKALLGVRRLTPGPGGLVG